MPYVTVGKENSGNIDLYYEDQGSGRPVVLVHGWPLSGRSWERQTDALLEAGYRVIAYDRRGFGASSKPASGYDYDTLAQDLEMLLATLDLTDVAIAGFSMGGGEVARYLGSQGAGRVSRAAFLGAIPPFFLKTADNAMGVDPGVFEKIKAGLKRDRPAFLTGFFKDFFNVDQFGGKLVSDEYLRACWSVAVGASPKATLDCVTAWLTDFRKDLASISIPTLVVHGDADRIVPLAVSGQRTHEAVKGSKLVVVKGGPHGILWTHADEVNGALLEFLA